MGSAIKTVAVSPLIAAQTVGLAVGSEDGFCEGDQGSHCPRCVRPYVFRGQVVDNAFVSFPNYWKHLFEDTPLCGAVPLGDGPECSLS